MNEEKILEIARLLRIARSCEAGDVPCPFCDWPEDDAEESGCIMWARKIARIAEQ